LFIFLAEKILLGFAGFNFSESSGAKEMSIQFSIEQMVGPYFSQLLATKTKWRQKTDAFSR
jgi:hypothetical protein